MQTTRPHDLAPRQSTQTTQIVAIHPTYPPDCSFSSNGTPPAPLLRRQRPRWDVEPRRNGDRHGGFSLKDFRRPSNKTASRFEASLTLDLVSASSELVCRVPRLRSDPLRNARQADSVDSLADPVEGFFTRRQNRITAAQAQQHFCSHPRESINGAIYSPLWRFRARAPLGR